MKKKGQGGFEARPLISGGGTPIYNQEIEIAGIMASIFYRPLDLLIVVVFVCFIAIAATIGLLYKLTCNRYNNYYNNFIVPIQTTPKVCLALCLLKRT